MLQLQRCFGSCAHCARSALMDRANFECSPAGICKSLRVASCDGALGEQYDCHGLATSTDSPSGTCMRDCALRPHKGIPTLRRLPSWNPRCSSSLCDSLWSSLLHGLCIHRCITEDRYRLRVHAHLRIYKLTLLSVCPGSVAAYPTP